MKQHKTKRGKFSIKFASLVGMMLLVSCVMRAEFHEQAAHLVELRPAWKALRAGKLSEAKETFSAAIKETPDRVEALNGLGYIALREGNIEEASERFAKSLSFSSDDRDALMGMAFVERNKGEFLHALRRLDIILKAYPEDKEARSLRLQIESTISKVLAARGTHLAPEKRPENLQLPMRVNGRVLELLSSEGSYRPVFLKAINLGATLPGKFPSQFPNDTELYRKWFTQMRDCGFTAVRVYTSFPPVFYDTLADFNRNRLDPLYLIHGVWAELPEDNDFSTPTFVESFRAEIRRVIDLLHGALDLPARPGHASGHYRSDVSRWWVATILGREWEPESVVTYNALKPDKSDFKGRFLTVRNANAMERWLAEQTDYAIAYETDRWNAQRPIAWTNWPTLDPLYHPTETTKAEENTWRVRFDLPPEPGGVREYDNDAVGLDMEKFESTPLNHGGLFTSYHAYPYYPDFMIYDPKYRTARDVEGPNSYSGYLRDLLTHHRKHPVFIAEFGVPTSREVAHIQPQEWTHGGHNEITQGEIDARLFRSIYNAGVTGGSLFAWIDEWFKHNWLVIDFHRPLKRNPLWHDRQDAEQNYGLIGYRAGATTHGVIIDGKENDWEGEDILLKTSVNSAGIIRSLSVKSDETDLFLMLKVKPGTQVAFAVAIDVIDASLGNFRFPAGLNLKSSVGFEAALLFDGKRASVVIDQTYDRWTNNFKRPHRPKKNDSGIYVSPKIKPNRMRISRKGEVFPEVVLDIGWLSRGTTDRRSPKFDDRAEWQFDPTNGVAEFRIPWGLLNVTDPSSRSVLFEEKDYPKGFRKTEGFRFAVAAFNPTEGNYIISKDGKVLDVLPSQGPYGIVSGLPLYSWKTWEVPTYHTFTKKSYGILCNELKSLPDIPVDITIQMNNENSATIDNP